MSLARLFAALLSLFLLAVPAQAEERIRDFSSDITLTPDGVLHVSETITVMSEGISIRRGIYRDFPTSYDDRLGNRIRVGFEVGSVSRNGRDEPYAIENIDNGKRVRIGDADVELDPGEHVYKIVYTTTRQVGFFADYDEIYWNVTGNGWAFPIDAASATIHLPDGAVIRQLDAYTGPQGSTDQNASVAKISDREAEFRTSMPLGPNEGLTIAAAFNKGVIAPPTSAEETAAFFRDNGAILASLVGVIALFAYYLFIWHRVGRDPQRGVVVPLFAPPRSLSPAALRFVWRMGYDSEAFSAALVGIAVKSYLKISEDGGVYTLTRTGKSESDAGLNSGERGVVKALFPSSNTLELKNENHSKVSAAIAALKAALNKEEEGKYFVTNLEWFIVGTVIMFASAACAVLFADDPGAAGFVLIWLSIWSAGTSFLLFNAGIAWAAAFAGGRFHFFGMIKAILSSLFALPFLAGLLAGFFFLGMTLPVLAMVGLVIQGVLAFVFYRLLKAPTVAGAKLLDEIEGFRMFLTIAERQRLEILHPPDVTPELFEKFLPYAMALDAETEWTRKFEAEAARAGLAPHTHSPGWYSGSRGSFGRGFASGLGASLASATASAAVAPGKSSGSFGGGSSGGGGGGGGGGGW